MGPTWLTIQLKEPHQLLDDCRAIEGNRHDLRFHSAPGTSRVSNPKNAPSWCRLSQTGTTSMGLAWTGTSLVWNESHNNSTKIIKMNSFFHSSSINFELWSERESPSIVPKTSSYSPIWILGPTRSIGTVVDITRLIINATYADEAGPALRGSDQSRCLGPPSFDLHGGPHHWSNSCTIIGPKKTKKKLFKSQMEGPTQI